MHSYKVIAPVFFGGVLCTPESKRSVLSVDKAFVKVPSWLEPLQESAGARKKRLAGERKASEAAAKKAKADLKDVEDVQFMDDAGSSDVVETL